MLIYFWYRDGFSFGGTLIVLAYIAALFFGFEFLASNIRVLKEWSEVDVFASKELPPEPKPPWTPTPSPATTQPHLPPPDDN